MPRNRDGSSLVQVSPKELRRRRPGESDADVRARYRRERELEARVAKAEAEVRNYDSPRKRNGPYEEAFTDALLIIPRERARRRYLEAQRELREAQGNAKGGKVKKMAKGGKVSCRRGDGICRQGHTKGKMR